MTASDTGEQTFAAGFDLARRLRDPALRKFLKSIGHAHGSHIVVAMEDEPVVDVLARILIHETGGSALIAIADGTEPFGFQFVRMTVEEAEPPTDALILSPESSMGMVSAAATPCGHFVPSEWLKALRFERASAPA